MSTLTIPADRFLTDLRPGDIIRAVDGVETAMPRTVEEVDVAVGQTHAVRLAAHLGSPTWRMLYPGNHESALVIREDPKPEPFSMTRRGRYALRRNPRYAPLLRSLLDGPRRAKDRGEGVTLAAMGVDHTWGYGWTERGPRHTWQITQAGRAALVAHDQEETP